MGTQFLTENEVAARTRISLGTLRRWRLENKGSRYHKFGSLVPDLPGVGRRKMLLDDIIDLAANTGQSITVLLRKCIVLAHQVWI